MSKRLKKIEENAGNIAMVVKLEKDINKRQRNEDLINRVDNALTFAQRAYEELLEIKKSLQEANYKETSDECERMAYEAVSENQNNQDNIQHDSNSSMVIIKEEFDYLNYFPFHEEEEERSPPIDVLLKEDKILPEDLWMMQNKAENFDNKTVIELGENSGVFINKSALKRITSRAQSANVLARGIMCELFTSDALRKSSLDGKASDEEDKKRPRLPTVAVEVMLKYVRSHANKYDWKITSDTNIRNSLRDKLKELRKKKKLTNSNNVI